jgi:hypothetical protein
MHTRRKKQTCLSQFSVKCEIRLVIPEMEKAAGQQIRQGNARGTAKRTLEHTGQDTERRGQERTQKEKAGHREERTGENTEGEGRTQRAEDTGHHTHLIYSFLAASSSTHCGSPGSMYCMKYLRHRRTCSARRNMTIL